MKIVSVPRILVSGLSSRVDSLVISIGLLSELRRAGIGVAACVIGPHLQQAVVLRRISGRFARCIDVKLLSYQQIVSELYLASIGSEMVLLVGDGALFDGSQPNSLQGSDAEIARGLKTPVLLAVDAHGWGNSLSAALKGYLEFDDQVDIRGLFLDKLFADGDPPGRDLNFYRDCFAGRGFPEIVGGLPCLPMSYPNVPRGISQSQNLTLFPREFFLELGRAVRKNVDIDQILSLASHARDLRVESFPYEPSGNLTRIAVSDDVCFNLCFQSNLELLRYFGAKIVSFSPIADVRLPRDIGAVYITGACLSEYGRDLQANRDMIEAIQEFAAAGGVVFSEGAGTAYLANEFQDPQSGEMWKGVGLISGSAHFKGGNPGEHHFQGVIIDECILGSTGQKLRGIDTGDWEIKESQPILKALRLDLEGSSLVYGGFSPTPQIFSTFHLINLSFSPEIAQNMVKASAAVKKTG